MKNRHLLRWWFPDGRKARAFREQKQVDDAGQGDKDSHFSEFEHAEPFQSCVKNHAVDYQVGRSANQGADASENGHIRKGNQEISGRKFDVAGPPFDDRGKMTTIGVLFRKAEMKAMLGSMRICARKTEVVCCGSSF